MSIEKIKTFEEFKKELDFETTKKLTEIFQMIAKKTNSQLLKAVNFYLGGIMIEEQEIRAELIKRKIKEGMDLTDNEFDFCDGNKHLFQKVRFKKVRKAIEKWQTRKS